MDHWVDHITLYDTETVGLWYSKELDFLKPSWCASCPMNLLASGTLKSIPFHLRITYKIRPIQRTKPQHNSRGLWHRKIVNSKFLSDNLWIPLCPLDGSEVWRKSTQWKSRRPILLEEFHVGWLCQWKSSRVVIRECCFWLSSTWSVSLFIFCLL